MPNIFQVTAVPEYLKTNTEFYVEYELLDSDRIDIICQKYYNDSTYEFLVYAFNDIVDPEEDLPKFGKELDRYILGKVPSGKSQNDRVFSGNDLTSYRDYYVSINNTKKKIKLPKPPYVELVIQAIERNYE